MLKAQARGALKAMPVIQVRALAISGRSIYESCNDK